MARRATGRRGAAEIAAGPLSFRRHDLLAGQRARRDPRAPGVAWPEWLGEQPADEARLKSLLAPYPSDAMICWPVSARVAILAPQAWRGRNGSASNRPTR